MIFIILSWKNHRTPRFLLDVVGSHEHNSLKVHELLIRAHVSTEECLKSRWLPHVKRILFKKFNTQKKTRCSTVSTFSFFQEILLFLPFKIQQGEPSGRPEAFRHFRRNLICIEPYCGKSAGLKCDRSKSMEAPWSEKQDLFLSWKNQFCFGTYVHAKQIFQLYMNLYQCVYICTSKQLVSSLCVDRSLFLNAFVLEWFLNGVQCRCWSFWRFKMDQAFDISIEMTQKC